MHKTESKWSFSSSKTKFIAAWGQHGQYLALQLKFFGNFMTFFLFPNFSNLLTWIFWDNQAESEHCKSWFGDVYLSQVDLVPKASERCWRAMYDNETSTSNCIVHEEQHNVMRSRQSDPQKRKPVSVSTLWSCITAPHRSSNSVSEVSYEIKWRAASQRYRSIFVLSDLPRKYVLKFQKHQTL